MLGDQFVGGGGIDDHQRAAHAEFGRRRRRPPTDLRKARRRRRTARSRKPDPRRQGRSARRASCYPARNAPARTSASRRIRSCPADAFSAQRRECAHRRRRRRSYTAVRRFQAADRRQTPRARALAAACPALADNPWKAEADESADRRTCSRTGKALETRRAGRFAASA